MPSYRFRCDVCNRERDVEMSFKDAPPVGPERIGFSSATIGTQPICCECGANCYQRIWGRSSTFRLNFRRSSI